MNQEDIYLHGRFKSKFSGKTFTIKKVRIDGGSNQPPTYLVQYDEAEDWEDLKQLGHGAIVPLDWEKPKKKPLPTIRLIRR